MHGPDLRLGDWQIEPGLNRLVRGRVVRRLEPKAMDVLVYLLERSGEVVALHELLERVWPDRVVEPSAVHQRIATIRKALGDDARNPTYLETIPRRGYRAILPPGADQGSPESDEAANYLMRRASFKWLESADPDGVLPLVNKALALDPKNLDALRLKASMLLVRGAFGLEHPRLAYASVRSLIDKMLELHPGRADPYAVAGALAAREELDFRKAMQLFRKAESLGAGSIGPLVFWKMETLFQACRYEDALTLAREWAKAMSARGEPLAYAAQLVDRLGDANEAGRLFDEALSLAPTNKYINAMAFDHYLYSSRDQVKAARLLHRNDQRDRENHAKLLLSLGNARPYRRLVAGSIRRRRSQYESSWQIERAFYRIGSYREHISWFRTRVEESDSLVWIPDFLRTTPGYWTNLEQWAVAHDVEAQHLLSTHRDLIQGLTANMNL